MWSVDLFGSQNLPLPPRIYPYFQQLYMRPSQNLPLPPRIYPPPFNNYMRSCQNLPLPSWIYPPPFSTTIILSEPRRIYPSLPEYTPLFNNYNIMRPSQHIPLPPRIYPLFNNSMRCSQNLPLLPRIYLPPFQQMHMCAPGSTPPSQNIPPPLSTTIILCEPRRIYPSLPKYTPLFNNYNIMRPS